MITIACWVLSVATTLAVAVLGTSAAVPPVPGSPRWPPYALSVHPPDGVVYAIEAVGTLAGAVALWRLLTVLRREWDVDVRWLHAAGFLTAGVVTLLPPVGSADIKIYVAYGQMDATGVNPYTFGPQSPGVPQDALTQTVEAPWQRTPTVYGPVFTRISSIIAHVAHGDGHVAVFLTRALLTAGFVLTGVVLHALCDTAAGRRRAAVLWSANPLLLATLVAGGHLDALVTAAMVASFALLRRFPFLAGALIGLAATLKLTGLVALPGLLWASRHRLRAPVLVLVGAAAVALPWIVATSGVFHQLSHATHYATPAVPWRAVSSLLQPLFGRTAARSLVGLVTGALGLALALLLLRRRIPPAAGTTAARAAAVTVAFGIGWLLTSSYLLPWYDALVWAPLALVGASFLDRVLLVHTTALTLAFLPGRDMPLTPVTNAVMQVVHSVLSPLTIAVLVVATAWLAVRSGSRDRPLRPPAVPAGRE